MRTTSALFALLILPALGGATRGEPGPSLELLGSGTAYSSFDRIRLTLIHRGGPTVYLQPDDAAPIAHLQRWDPDRRRWARSPHPVCEFVEDWDRSFPLAAGARQPVTLHEPTIQTSINATGFKKTDGEILPIEGVYRAVVETSTTPWSRNRAPTDPKVTISSPFLILVELGRQP